MNTLASFVGFEFLCVRFWVYTHSRRSCVRLYIYVQTRLARLCVQILVMSIDNNLLPTSGEYSPEYVKSLLVQLQETLTQPDAWQGMTLDELVAVAETLVRLDVSNAEFPALLSVIDSLIVSNCTPESVDAKNLSKLLNSYAHLGFANGRLLDFLKRRKSLADMEPCHISGIMFALGRLKVGAGGVGASGDCPFGGSVGNIGMSMSELTTLLQRLCVRSGEVIDRFSPLEVSTVVFALARLGHRNVRLLHLFSDLLSSRIMDASPQIISNTIYAMGKLGFKSQNLLDAVCVSGGSRLSLFKPQELANLVYAFGQLEYRNESFLLQLADHVPPRLPTFKPQELSITAYAFSQLRVAHPRMFSGIAIQIARRIDECSPQAISNTVYAMSKLNFRHNGLLTALALSLPARLGELTPQHVSNIMYSFGKLNHRDDSLLEAICAHVPNRLWEFRPQNIANTVYATGKLGFFSEGLLASVAEHLPYRLEECVSQDISNIVYSFGQLGYRNLIFFEKIREYVCRVLMPSGMQQKDLSYLMSAFRKVGMELSLDDQATVAPTSHRSDETSHAGVLDAAALADLLSYL